MLTRSYTPIVSVDVDYQDDTAQAAGVLFDDWQAAAPLEQVVVPVADVAAYVPGQFYKRELPCVLAALRALSRQPQLIIVDGYVWLGDETHPGLGAHLFNALGGTTPVVGVAKTSFRGATGAIQVTRGVSQSPLFVTAAGIDALEAADKVRQMHGSHRLPTLLKLADRLCRQWPQQGR